ncbi:MAG TPA: phosphatase PAP2 family protein, partial [Rhizomicrobium sp.]
CLAVAVSSGATIPFDNFFRSGIHRWASPSLTMLAYGVSLLGSVAVLAVLFAIALAGFWIAGRPRPKIVLVWAMGGAVVIDNVLKYSFHRVRPEPFFGPAPETYSFPSGHMLFSCCFYGALACILAASFRSGLSRAMVWVAVVLLVTAIGLSRIYLGFHYPTDVIGGLLVATFWINALISFGTFNDVTKRL